MFSKALIALTLVSAACANVFTTSPTASTTFQAGQPCQVTWQDDGTTPSLSSFGPAMISIYVGNALQQTSLQTLNSSVDVSKTNSITFTPDPTIGPNGNQYFIRYQSLSLKDASQPQYPALAFSAKFTLSGMTGNFSAAVEAQIEGQSTAPLASQTGTVSVTSVHASTTAAGAAASTVKASSSTPSASATKSSSGAINVKAGWAGALLGALVGVTMF